MELQEPPAVRAAPLEVSATAGIHLCADLWGCDPSLLTDQEFLRELAMEAAERTGATVLDVSTVSFPPRPPLTMGGVTVVAILAESHLSIHTYPEAGYVAIDIFCCGSGWEPQQGYAYLKGRLLPAEEVVIVVRRGVPKGLAATES